MTRTRGAVEPPTLAGAARDAKRDFVLQNAQDEFVERGLEGATMRGIALRCGCTTGAIYPLFASKQAIYAALLERSLARLDAAVAAAIDPTAAPAVQVRHACLAFTAYYLAHRFEVNLGLYAFRGLKRQGTGRRSDLALNRALGQVLARIAAPLAAAGGLAADEARACVTLLFTQMIGSLVLQIAGRLDAFGTDARAMVDAMLDHVVGAEAAD